MRGWPGLSAQTECSFRTQIRAGWATTSFLTTNTTAVWARRSCAVWWQTWACTWSPCELQRAGAALRSRRRCPASARASHGSCHCHRPTRRRQLGIKTLFNEFDFASMAELGQPCWRTSCVLGRHEQAKARNVTNTKPRPRRQL